MNKSSSVKVVTIFALAWILIGAALWFAGPLLMYVMPWGQQIFTPPGEKIIVIGGVLLAMAALIQYGVKSN